MRLPITRFTNMPRFKKKRMKEEKEKGGGKKVLWTYAMLILAALCLSADS